MLKNILFIAKKDFHYSLKEKTLLMWLFLMPIVFFGFIGSTTGGFAKKNTNSVINIAVWEKIPGDAKNYPIATQIMYRLEQEGFTIKLFNDDTDLEQTNYTFEDYTRKLWLPAQLSQQIAANEQVTITYDTTANGLTQSRDQFAIEKALYQTLGDLLIFNKRQSSNDEINFDQINALEKNILTDITSAGEKLNIPAGFNQAVPGILVMFIMLIALSSGALSIFLERQSGVLKRLAASPLSRKEIVLGKWLGKWLITIVQMIYGMFIGWLLFNIHWGDHLFTIVMILLIWAIANAALAVLLGSLATSEGQVSAIATISSLLLAALGGCWWPIEITPQWMQKLAHFLPTGWVMEALHQLMYFGGQLQQVMPQVFALVVLAVIALNVAFKKFRFS